MPCYSEHDEPLRRGNRILEGVGERTQSSLDTRGGLHRGVHSHRHSHGYTHFRCHFGDHAYCHGHNSFTHTHSHLRIDEHPDQ